MLEREREMVTGAGELSSECDRIHLDRLDAAQLEREGMTAELVPAGRTEIPATDDHVGSEVVMFGV